MKAVVYYDYGGPDVLRHAEVERPTLPDDHILVKVRAASVNPLDWHVLHGTPYLMRIASGLGKPKSIRLGVDFSGTVEVVGRSVTTFNVGDAVLGAASGALAEYVTVPARGRVVRKPERLTFEQAAAVTVAGTTALQALRRKTPVQLGQKVIVYGASGGVGTFAVQLAKAFGAEVTGVQSSGSLDLVRSIGADRVIDYTKEDFTESAECKRSQVGGIVATHLAAAGRSHAVRRGHTGYRPLLDVRRGGRGDSPSRIRPPARQGRRHDRQERFRTAAVCVSTC